MRLSRWCLGRAFGEGPSDHAELGRRPVDRQEDRARRRLGVGAQYQLTDNLSVRGEYERGFGIGKDANKTDPSLLSVGAVFSTY